MARPTVITQAMKKRIRELHALGVPFARIARELGINQETAKRHSSDKYETKIRAMHRARYDKERADRPEVVERRRQTAREYARKKRAEYKASGVRADKKKVVAEVTTRGNSPANLDAE